MENNDKILSIRIVSVDYYLQRPVQNFDICYSKFRGSTIKKVPIIRLFGSTLFGDKLCCHVHGAFPYIYIPFDNVAEENIDNFLHQMANNLDKAINIQQGQTNSKQQHVVNIQIVRGTPIYGYHVHEHQFLKIYFSNPVIVRRVANLLQNGAIFGKVYQPLEAHIPFILQFFIDFNLYGMSFLYTPKDCVVYRSANAFQNHLKKVSTCDIEIDIFTSTILNGKTDFNLSQQHSNPGIASLWVDERLRRLKYSFDPSEKVPALESLLHRTNSIKEKKTKSDLFYQELLAVKLSHFKPVGNSKQQLSNKNNLSAILSNSVYPIECSASQKLYLDASTVHLSNSFDNTLFMQLRKSKPIIIDEALISSQSSWNTSFKAEDVNLLAIMNDLEHIDCTQIEDNSLLAPLTQSINTPVADKIGEISLVNVNEEKLEVEEEEDVVNFSLPLYEDLLPNTSSTSNYSDASISVINREEIITQGIECVRSPQERTKISSLAELKMVEVASLKNIEIKDALIQKIIKNPPLLCITKLSFEKLENVEAFSHQYDLMKNHVPSQGPSNRRKKLLIENHNQISNVVVTPLNSALPPWKALELLEQYSIPKIAKQTIFHSDFENFARKKEVGQLVLYIPSNRLIDVKLYTSLLSDLFTIDKRRQNIVDYLNTGIKIRDYDDQSVWISRKRQSSSILCTVENFKSLISNDRKCAIRSSLRPPHSEEAKNWHKDHIIGISAEKPTEIHTELLSVKEKQKYQQHSYTITPSINSHRLTEKTVQKCRLLTTLNFFEYREQRQLSNLNLSLSKTNIKQGKRHLRLQKSFRKKVDLGVNLSTITHNLTETKRQWRKVIYSTIEDSRKGLMKQTVQKTDKTFSKYIDGTTVDSNSRELSCATLENTYGFKMNLENLQSVKADIKESFLTILSIEIFVRTRDNFRPDPDLDPVAAIFYSIFNDVSLKSTESIDENGMIINRDTLVNGHNFKNCQQKNFHVKMATNELDLFQKLHQLVSLWNPDIFAGYEIEMSSWGYLLQRANAISINLKKKLSRIPGQKEEDHKSSDDNIELIGSEFIEFDTDIKITGRILLDIWRLLRHEVTLTSYTFENCTYHILHQRFPLYSHKKLTIMWESNHTIDLVIDYYMIRVTGNIKLLNQLDLVGRTCELAKLFGIQFYEVLSRGSQFRVESMMLRIAKPRNLLSVSPSVAQRAHMRAPEHIPLILEPESRMYLDPMVVLDFQSLYPSIIIAYNYCFSTCLGRVEHLGNIQPFEFGASRLQNSPKLVKQYLDNNQITVSPCGVAFVKNSIRTGVLPRMLEEILETRLMVKQSMKLYKNNNALQRVLHARQLGLKLIANVVYGYTAANFSGRMPCIEVGDSVVSKGKETLERAIKLVEMSPQWKARVVYGDTDSLFVQIPGRNRQEAFRIGEEIATSVTNDNPSPIKLKLEKVYQPSILQTKKRYVGYMYESADQKEPKYEAKGIETVRRDGCPAVAKMLEKVIRILFETNDVSAVKLYVCRQFSKILASKVNLKDFIFAKEFRGLNGYKPGACVPSLELATKWMKIDKRCEPRRGERVPYVIVNGAVGLPLIKLVKSPYEVLHNDGLRLNVIYYITKAIIPPLNRCLYLIGADVNEWFSMLPRKYHDLYYHVSNLDLQIFNLETNKKRTVSQYFSTTKCAANCDNETLSGLCATCRSSPQATILEVMNDINKADRELATIRKICQNCCSRFEEIKCMSLDCPILFIVDAKDKKHKQTMFLNELIKEYY